MMEDNAIKEKLCYLFILMFSFPLFYQLKIPCSQSYYTAGTSAPSYSTFYSTMLEWKSHEKNAHWTRPRKIYF